jgi:hypothetical protein
MRHTTRFYLGLAFLGLSLILPLFGLLVVRLPLSLAIKATIIGLLTVGGPELFGILAVICLGKENLLRIKQKFMSLLRRLRPPSPVSRTRYRMGLVMFLLPLIPTYVMAYAPQWLPDNSPLRLYVNLTADFIFLSGLFVLGGDFWDKLRALFVYDARVEFRPLSPDDR